MEAMEKSMLAVIMTGGKGARFWSRSREKMPKHLLDIQSKKTMIREWDALWEESPKDADGNAVRDRFLGVDSGDSLVYSPEKLVAIVGVRDIRCLDERRASHLPPRPLPGC